MAKSKQLLAQQRKLDSAESYQKWEDEAVLYDEMSGADKWREIEQSERYDHAQIRHRLERLRSFRASGDNLSLLFTINEGVHGNMGGMGKSELYSRSKLGTKYLIEDYVNEIASALEHLANVDDNEISFDEKHDLFHRASLCYGTSALMLSGGGSLGHFHLGVLKALMEQELVPTVLSGSSAGSFVSALFGTRTNHEMSDYLSSDEVFVEAKEEASWINRFIFGKSEQFDVHSIEDAIDRLIPDLTFQEAYELTGYRINISIAPAELHQTSRLLNAITSPNVYVRKAVLASCAVPGVFPSVTLEAKNIRGERQKYLPTRKWVDGSLSDDLPAKRLARLYGVNHYIGSLINPIVMFAHDDSVKGGSIGTFARRMGHKGVTGWTKSMQSLTQRYGKDWPRLKLFTTMAHSVFQQDYTADIAIYPDFHNFQMRKILSPLTGDELMALVRQGELATWRKMGMIRTSSKISRVLDKILLEYESIEHLNFRYRHAAQSATG